MCNHLRDFVAILPSYFAKSHLSVDIAPRADVTVLPFSTQVATKGFSTWLLAEDVFLGLTLSMYVDFMLEVDGRAAEFGLQRTLSFH
jgi:hypothetical protein